MKFVQNIPCKCGGALPFTTCGDVPFQDTVCPKCGAPGYLIDPLSVSVVAERLLHSSRDEFDSGDYSLSILLGAIAVETFLTRLYLKLKGMDSLAITFTLPTPAQEVDWEKEYPRSGGFPGPADFASRALTGKMFDDFVFGNKVAKDIFAILPDTKDRILTKYFQAELFKRRNRIAHWGYVNSAKADAELCCQLSVAIVSILREMDKSKYSTL